MTPQKKAIELVERMAIYHWVDGVCKYEEAKQCALIAVDEIIKDLKESLKVAEDLHLHARGLIIGSFVDWQEVKKEIEKL
jgi:hypothetical protein